MKPTIIFIEGLPGSGKTTFAKKLAEHYEALGKDVRVFNEGDLHPVDLAWCSVTNLNEYKKLLNEHLKYNLQINSNTKIENDKYVTAYTKIRVADEDVSLYKDFEKHEIYRTDNLEEFKLAHLNLWRQFNSEKEHGDIYIFECVFLQNHINELILKYNKKKTYIEEYFNDLLETLSNFKLKLFYVKQLNIEKTLEKVSEERRSDNETQKDWIEFVIEYITSQRYSKEFDYVGYEGVVRYFIDRQNLELEMIPNLKIETKIIDLDDNYEKVFNEIIETKL